MRETLFRRSFLLGTIESLYRDLEALDNKPSWGLPIIEILDDGVLVEVIAELRIALGKAKIAAERQALNS